MVGSTPPSPASVPVVKWNHAALRRLSRRFKSCRERDAGWCTRARRPHKPQDRGGSGDRNQPVEAVGPTSLIRTRELFDSARRDDRVWRSLEARLVRDQEVAGSSPATRIARVAQMEEQRSYTPTVGGSMPFSCMREHGGTEDTPARGAGARCGVRVRLPLLASRPGDGTEDMPVSDAGALVACRCNSCPGHFRGLGETGKRSWLKPSRSLYLEGSTPSARTTGERTCLAPSFWTRATSLTAS